jgi:hypothetical protein
MKKLLYNYSRTVEYDKILATEVYPAIAKALGTLTVYKDSALLIAAAERLTECVGEWSKVIRDSYAVTEVNEKELEKYRAAFSFMDTLDLCNKIDNA